MDPGGIDVVSYMLVTRVRYQVDLVEKSKLSMDGKAVALALQAVLERCPRSTKCSDDRPQSGIHTLVHRRKSAMF